MVDLATWPTNAEDAGEDLWEKMAKRWFTDGVIAASDTDQLQVFADATGMQIKVKAGEINIAGFHAELPTQIVMGVGTADGTNDRFDRAIARLDRTGPSNKIKLLLQPGTPAGSPQPPALVNSSSFLDLSLGKVLVGHGVGTITADKVIDERTYMVPRNLPLPKTIQGNLLEDGTKVVAHGVPSLQLRASSVLAVYKGPSGELKPLRLIYIDGDNIYLGDGLSPEASFRPFVVRIQYQDTNITW